MRSELTTDFLHNLLDSLQNQVLFADTGHVVRFLNQAAKDFYSGGGEVAGEQSA